MNLYIVDTLFGRLLIDESGTTKNFIAFGTDSSSIQVRLEEFKAIPRSIYENLVQEGGITTSDAVIVESESLVAAVKDMLPCEVKVETPGKGGQIIREQFLLHC